MDGAVSEAERRAFARKSFFIAAMYIIVTSAMSFLTVSLGVLQDFLINNVYLAFIGIALVLVSCIVLSAVPLKSPYNIIAAILLVASLTISVGTVSALHTPTMVLAAYATTITVAVLVSLFSVFIACDMTQEGSLVVRGVLEWSVWINIIIMIALAYKKSDYILIPTIFMALTHLIYLMFHTQVICGNKFAVTEKFGTIGASILIYVNVTVTYIFILHIYRDILKKKQ